jgi:hypothetical protein
MPNTDVPIDPGLAAIERSPCAKRDRQMMSPGMLSQALGFVIRTFEGIACDYIERVAANMIGWIRSRELRPPGQ